MNLAAVILAAGYSTRMNGFKPLMELGGASLLTHCARLFHLVGIDRVIVVSGHRHSEVATEAAKLGLTCIYNNDHDLGMYSSVCAAIPELTEIDGFFLLPVDIPLVRSSTVTTLMEAFRGNAVVYPCFEGLRGHPPLIPAELIPLLAIHDGRSGLRSFLEKQQYREIPVWDRGILLDADTPEDFAALVQKFIRMAIGESAEALALARLAMPKRGIAHGLAVAAVALRVGRALNRCGGRLDEELLYNAALLHDIGKGQPQHEARGSEILRKLGLTDLAKIVAAHRDIPPLLSQGLTEKEVVCLADKLVRGEKSIPVVERFAEKLALFDGDAKACRAIRARLENALALQGLVEQAVGQRIENILTPEDPS